MPPHPSESHSKYKKVSFMIFSLKALILEIGNTIGSEYLKFDPEDIFVYLKSRDPLGPDIQLEALWAS